MASSAALLGLETRTLASHEHDILHRVREAAVEIDEILSELGSSREIDVARTRLEESVMWAAKHVGLHGAA